MRLDNDQSNPEQALVPTPTQNIVTSTANYVKLIKVASTKTTTINPPTTNVPMRRIVEVKKPPQPVPVEEPVVSFLDDDMDIEVMEDTQDIRLQRIEQQIRSLKGENEELRSKLEFSNLLIQQNKRKIESLELGRHIKVSRRCSFSL